MCIDVIQMFILDVFLTQIFLHSVKYVLGHMIGFTSIYLNKTSCHPYEWGCTSGSVSIVYATYHSLQQCVIMYIFTEIY